MQSPDPTDEGATLRPGRGVVARWSAVGGVACLLAVWIALDARDSVLAWGFAALCVVLTGYVVLQLARPDAFAVRLDASGIRVDLPWQHRHLPWDRIHLARVVTVAGEPLLELHVWDPDDPARAEPRATGVLLPMGVDLAVLHAHLDRWLGRSDDAPTERPLHPEHR